MPGLIQDARQSLRLLFHSPAFTVTAVAALALGIGANTAVFSIASAVLLRPIPAPHFDRIVQFMIDFPGISIPGGSPRAFYFWRQQTRIVRNVSALRLELLNLTGRGEPQQLATARVSAGFFQLFGAAPSAGRLFTSDEERPGGPRVAVLSHELWTSRFGADRSIVGRTISLSGEAYTVVGVLWPAFKSEQFDQRPDVWIPYQMAPASTDGDCYCRVLASLQPDVTFAAANAQLKVANDAFRRDNPAPGGSKISFSVVSLRDAMIGDVRPLLWILAGAVALVLLIACTNVANLALLRASVKRRDIAVRAALGASRGRLVRQLLTESVILSILGGILGLFVGLASIRAILALFPGNPLLGRLDVIGVFPRIGGNGSAFDWRVLAFTFVLSLVTGVLFGVIPALQASRLDLTTALNEASGRTSFGFRENGTRSVLVISQIALAIVLLVGAALLIRSSLALQDVHPGFDSHNVLVMQMSLAGSHFEKTSELNRLVLDGVESIHALPGVSAAAVSCCIPLETVWQNFFTVQGRPLTGRFHGVAGWTFISPEYFDAFRIPVLRGHRFTTRDDASSPGVVIINETMARLFWPHGDPLKDRLLVGRGMRPEYDRDPIRQIVGIVADVHARGLTLPPRPEMYIPIAQLPDAINALNLRLLPVAWIVRTSVEPHTLSAAIQEQVRKGTGQPVANVRTMDEVASQSTARTKFNTLLMTIFGCSALLLAAVGIYGLIAYSIQQRTREFGIRIAVGAESAQLRNMILLEGVRLTSIGVAAGMAASFGLTRFMAGLLFGVKPWDPAVFVCVPFLLVLTALLAVWVPARRAARIDPPTALRYE